MVRFHTVLIVCERKSCKAHEEKIIGGAGKRGKKGGKNLDPSKKALQIMKRKKKKLMCLIVIYDLYLLNFIYFVVI